MRKQVYVKTFTDVSEINVDLVWTYLFEALEVDETLHQQKKTVKSGNSSFATTFYTYYCL